MTDQPGAPRSLDVSISSLDGTAFVELRGDVDAATCPQLRGRLMEVVSSGVNGVVIDCSRLAFMDSTGLGVLVETHKRLTERDPAARVTMRHASPSIRKLFNLTGLDSVIEVEY